MSIVLHRNTDGTTSLMLECTCYLEAHWAAGYLISEAIAFEFYGSVQTLEVKGGDRTLVLEMAAAAHARGFDVHYDLGDRAQAA